MKIGIVGAGAVGGQFGGMLARAGSEICFLARGRTLEKLREVGLTLIDAAGNRSTVQVPAANSFAELGGVDVVIVATKALPGQETFPGVPPGTPIVTTQNSVEVPYLAARRFGAENVLPGVVRGFMIHHGPAEVEFRGGPLSLNLGTFHRDSHHVETAAELAAEFNRAGIDAQYLPDVWVDVWAKAMFVTTFGALGAAAGKPLGYLRTELRSSLENLMSEVAEVARGHQVSLPDRAVAQTMAFADDMAAASTSSMQRDYAAGEASELDAQVGAIRRMGAAAGVDTPLHDLIHGVLAARGS